MQKVLGLPFIGEPLKPMPSSLSIEINIVTILFSFPIFFQAYGQIDLSLIRQTKHRKVSAPFCVEIEIESQILKVDFLIAKFIPICESRPTVWITIVD